MADPYIDPFETQLYGKFAREQMRDVCLGIIAEMDGSVRYAIKSQQGADEAMKAALDRQPAPQSAATDDPVADAADVLVRFNSYLGSLRGRPVEPSVFFRGETPSVVARRRLTKLVAAVAHVVTQLETHKSKIKDARSWLEELSDVHTRLAALEKRQRVMKTDRVDVAPEVAAQRLAWLEVYTANKAVVTGLLRHAGKLHLMPVIFDDLAEVHRVAGVSDEPVATPAPASAPASKPETP